MNQLADIKITHPWSEPPKTGTAIEIKERIWWIRMPLPFALDHVNIYALDEGDSWTIIDTGINSKKARAIWRDLLDGPLRGKPVSRVIVTHHHPDHMGLAGWFQSEMGASLWTTRTAWLFARMLHLDKQEVPTEESMAFWRAAGMNEALLAERAKERPFNFCDLLWPMPLGFRRIVQDDIITMGGYDWRVEIGHGHAPEQATFWCKDAHIVLSGDQILPGISPNIGVYATEPMANPLKEWLLSCERFAKMAHKDHLVLGGHKLPFIGLPLRLRNLIDNHHEALHRMRAHLKTPRTAADCFAILFKREVGAKEYGLALVEAVAHINYLYLNGELDRHFVDGQARYQMR